MLENNVDNQKWDYFVLLQQGPGKIALNVSYKSQVSSRQQYKALEFKRKYEIVGCVEI